MIDCTTLLSFVDRTVELRFADGHAVRAKLVLVEPDPPHEIIYDIVEVIAQGPKMGTWVKQGNVVAVDPAQLMSIVASE